MFLSDLASLALCRNVVAASCASACATRPHHAGSGDSTVLIEPYAPNIVRVSMSLRETMRWPRRVMASSPQPDGSGWKLASGSEGDELQSTALTVRLAPGAPPHGEAEAASIAISSPALRIKLGFESTPPDGKQLVRLDGWQMSVPNYKDGNADLEYDRRPHRSAVLTSRRQLFSRADEHDYGLGQNQQGFLDRRGHVIECAHDYNAPSGQSVCVPFLVTNKGYGLVWDNPSKTTVSLGFNDQNTFTSQVGQRVSFFIIAGDYDAIYRGYRLLTGDVPMLPKSAYGYIQCKQRYSSQAELMGVAKGYRDRHLPIDDLVIDWFTYTKMGEMDFDPKAWPDPEGMLKQLHAMNYHVMISVWPRFTVGQPLLRSDSQERMV